MHFRRIAVRNFRKLASPLVIEELGEGVTVIAGDNEEGKSTLLDAIRTGLFERHNMSGRAVEAMQPFGFSVRPEIQIDFEINGNTYSIVKGFAQRASALLTTANGTFEGPAAEERLAELLTFRVPQRGVSKPDDRGVLGACAVEVLMLGDWRAAAGEVGFWPECGHLAHPTLGWKSLTGRPERKRFAFHTRSMGTARPGASALAGQHLPQTWPPSPSA